MSITLLQPFNLDSTKDYTFSNATATGNVSANNVVVSNVVSATGNITGNYILGNGAFLTGITTGIQDKIANGNSNVYIPTANGNITFTTSGNANVVIITGTGINVSGYSNTSGNVIAGNFTTLGEISAAGNITGNYILGNGALLTGITTGIQDKIANGNSNVYIPLANGNVTITSEGNANIVIVTGTGVNIAGYANVTGNANIANIGTGVLTASGNVSGANLLTLGQVSATGNLTGNYILGNGAFLTGITTGVQDKIANGNSNVYIPTANGNVTITSEGNANIVIVTGTGVNIAGYANVTGNITSAGNLSISGNINANVITGNGSGLTNLAGANVTGQVGNALVAGTVYTAAQPNITSVGTLTGLTVGPNSSVILSGNTGFVRANSIQGRDGSQAIYPYFANVSGAVGIVSDLTVGVGGSGNLTVANGNVSFSGANVSLGDASNLHIDGGTFNYFLKTDGAGNLSWAAPSVSPGGGANELQFNDTGVFQGTANLLFDSVEYRLSLQNYSLVVNSLGGVSGATTINLTNGNYVKATAAGITTWIFTFAAPASNASGFVLELTNGGTYTMNWPLSVKWPGGVAPDLTATGVDVLVFITNDNGVTWRGALSMLNSL